jgi:hypothetical protein
VSSELYAFKFLLFYYFTFLLETLLCYFYNERHKHDSEDKENSSDEYEDMFQIESKTPGFNSHVPSFFDEVQENHTKEVELLNNLIKTQKLEFEGIEQGLRRTLNCQEVIFHFIDKQNKKITHHNLLGFDRRSRTRADSKRSTFKIPRRNDIGHILPI